MNNNYREGKYKAVKSSKLHPQAGPKKFRFRLEAAYRELLQYLKDYYFPGGNPSLENQFDFQLGPFVDRKFNMNRLGLRNM